jgi:hypothetical protein
VTHARAVERHARKLVRLHAKIKVEAVAIAGPDYDEHHAVGFEETASLDEQLRDTETGGEVFGDGLEDVRGRGGLPKVKRHRIFHTGIIIRKHARRFKHSNYSRRDFRLHNISLLTETAWGPLGTPIRL